jgi:hypothetical protein
MVMIDVRSLSRAEWQREISVSLLPIMIWPNSVHPQDDLLAIGVLQTMEKQKFSVQVQ